MSDPLFLTVAQVTALHRLSIERFGGANGIRDAAPFEGAITHPQQVYFYTQADLQLIDS